MNKKEIVASLVKIANDIMSAEEDKIRKAAEYRTSLGQKLVASIDKRDWLTVEEVGVICASCANKMKKRKISRVRKSALIKAMTWDECISEAKKKNVDNPEAFCGWLKNYGPKGDIKKSPIPVPKGYHPQKKK